MKRIIFLFVAISLLLTNILYAQYARNDAINLVLNTLLTNDVVTVDVYASHNSITTDLVLVDTNVVTNPYAESWVFFSDDNPFAGWYHDCRVIFVNSANGSYTISDVGIYPKYFSTDWDKISMVTRPEPVELDGIAFTPNENKDQSENNYALIIVAIDDARNWYNTSLVYNVLIQSYYYKEQNIIVLYSWDGNSYVTDYGNDLDGGDPSNDIDGPATADKVMQVIYEMKGEQPNPVYITEALGHENQLALFFIGEPVTYVMSQPYLSFPIDANTLIPFPVHQIANNMAGIDCAQMLFYFDINYSSDVSSYLEADYIPNVLCQNRFLTGPTEPEEENYAEMNFSGGNYSEQLFYWASAARGYLPDVWNNAPWNYINIKLGSENNGGFPYSQYIPDHLGDNVLDDDDDGFIQMEEAFQYADDMNSYTFDYYHYPDLEEPENPFFTNEFPFTEDLLDLSGLCGTIYQDQDVQGVFVTGTELKLGDNVDVIFDEGSELNLNGPFSSHSVQSSISFMANTAINAGYNGALDLQNGNLFIGNNVMFNLLNEEQLTIYINNQQNLSFENTYFNYCKADIHCNQLTMNHTNIQDSYLYTFSIPHITLLNLCNISNSSIAFDASLLSPLILSSLKVEQCNFNQCLFDFPWSIKAINYKDVFISRNNFENSGNALELWDCGYNRKPATIQYNTFHFNLPNGVILYNTVAAVLNNQFNNNRTGLRILNESSVAITGNSQATQPTETQYFNSNTVQAIYMSHATFHHASYNAFECTPPGTITFIYITGQYTPGYWQVRYNFWGSNFNPSSQLLPSGAYTYLPIWNLNSSGTGQDEAELIYDYADTLMLAENYTDSEIGFKQVISEYPTSKYSQASLKRLFTLCQYLSNDYQAFKEYLITDSTISNFPLLKKSAEKMANQCDIASENWIEAITWLETIIENPETIDDSIYSIIDLGKTYLLMENSNKTSSYVGKYPQYKPLSASKHMAYSNELLKLLPRDDYSKSFAYEASLKELKNGELLQNFPNPFNGTTQIWFKLAEESSVTVTVYDYTGKEVSVINPGLLASGNHSVEFNSANLSSGIYFYSLEVNGIKTDIKKMTIMR